MQFLRFTIVIFSFVPHLALTQKRLNLTPGIIFQREESINHYGYGFSVDYDNLKKKKRFSFNIGLGIFKIRGRKDYEVDSTFLKLRPNGTPNRPYYRISKQLGITIPLSLKMRVIKNEKSEFNTSIGFIPNFNLIHVQSGQDYIRPYFIDSTFHAGPYNYRYNYVENRSIFLPVAIPVFISAEYLANYSKRNQYNFRLTIARRRAKYFEDNIYISLGIGIRLNSKNYSR
jgi:hypothetical protein